MKGKKPSRSGQKIESFEVTKGGQSGDLLSKARGDYMLKIGFLSCGYFEEFFSFYRERTQREKPYDEKSKKAAKEKKNFLYNVAYGVGRGVNVLKRKE